MSGAELAKIVPACPRACAACPWRVANQGTEHPHRFYTPGNLARLWRGLRNGARMSCHPTDPRMAEFSGYEECGDREKTAECAGALVVVQREFMLFQGIVRRDPKGKALRQYALMRPRGKGMSRAGLVAVMERHVFAGSGLAGTAMATPDLADFEVGYPAALPWGVLEREIAFEAVRP